MQPVVADHDNSHRIRAVFHDNHLLRVITVSIAPKSHIVLLILTGQNTNSDLAERLRRMNLLKRHLRCFKHILLL